MIRCRSRFSILLTKGSVDEGVLSINFGAAQRCIDWRLVKAFVSMLFQIASSGGIGCICKTFPPLASNLQVVETPEKK
jgi:sorbitol-specific phosphotransferase system component IIBC